MGIPTPRISCDQPLWLKTVEVVSSKKLNAVVRLGGCHCLISFVASAGKAISKTLRGHYLMDSALHMTLFNLLMLQNEPSREKFNCRQSRATVTTAEVLTKEEVI